MLFERILTILLVTVFGPPVAAGEPLPGDGFNFGVGIVSGSVVENGGRDHWVSGVEFRSAYSLGALRINGFLSGLKNENFTFCLGLGASWVPVDGAVSPFFGGSLLVMTFEEPSEGSTGLVTQTSTGDLGLGLEVHLGLEAFRSEQVRLLLQAACRFPLFGRVSYRDRQTIGYPVIPTGSLAILF